MVPDNLFAPTTSLQIRQGGHLAQLLLALVCHPGTRSQSESVCTMIKDETVQVFVILLHTVHIHGIIGQ